MSNSDTAFNNLTGDADVVLAKARRYEELGLAIARSVTTLHRISEADENKSKAVAALKESAENVARDIGKAQERYSLTATALIAYSGKLKTAQDDAVTAISTISQAEGEVSAAGTKKTQADQKAEAAGDDQAVNQKAAENMADSYDTRVHELGVAQGLWHAARAAKDAAAKSAADDINDVVTGDVGDKLNDSRWDDWGSVLDAIKVVCEWAGVLAIFLSWVPILGAVLVGLALLGAVIALIDASVKLQRGEGSLSDVIFAAVGVVLAAFGGKLVTYLAKAAKAKSAGALAFRASKSKGLYAGQFKKVFGVTKTAARAELKSLTSFKGAAKEIFQNPFESKLGAGSNLAEKWLAGAKTEGLDALKNPLKLKSVDMPWGDLTAGAKVTLVVLDARQVGGSIEKLMNDPGNLNTEGDIKLRPESLLKVASNGVEGLVTR